MLGCLCVQEKLSPDDDLLDLSSEDEAVANDLDMHSLILSGLHQDTEPVKTAEEVIREIDDMMQVLRDHLLRKYLSLRQSKGL
jgi:hypothetical protein